MGRVELIAGALYVMLIIGRYEWLPFDESLLYYSTIILSGYYFISAIGISRSTFFLPALLFSEGKNRLKILFRMGAGFAFGLALWCVWLHETFHPWRDHVTLAVSFFLFLVMFFGVYFFEDSSLDFSKFILVRGVPLSLLLVLYMIISFEVRINWRYDDNYYRELLSYSIRNPQDEDAKIEAQRYYEQMRDMFSPSN